MERGLGPCMQALHRAATQRGIHAGDGSAVICNSCKSQLEDQELAKFCGGRESTETISSASGPRQRKWFSITQEKLWSCRSGKWSHLLAKMPRHG